MDGYNHLWFLFNQKAEKDSISKYSRLLNTQLEKHLNSIQTDAVSQVTSTYDSSKADKQIEAERRYRKTSKFAFLLLSLLFLALLFLFFHMYKQKRNTGGMPFDKVNRHNKAINHTEGDLGDSDASSVKRYRNEYDGLHSLSLSDTVMTIKRSLPPNLSNDTDIQQDLFVLKERTMEKMPHFFNVITDEKYSLTQQEIYLVLLSVLDFPLQKPLSY